MCLLMTTAVPLSYSYTSRIAERKTNTLTIIEIIGLFALNVSTYYAYELLQTELDFPAVDSPAT